MPCRVASAGDSRTILLTRTGDNTWQALPLTNDHRPGCEGEKQRLEEAGGRVEPKRLPSGRLGAFAGCSHTQPLTFHVLSPVFQRLRHMHGLPCCLGLLVASAGRSCAASGSTSCYLENMQAGTDISYVPAIATCSRGATLVAAAHTGSRPHAVTVHRGWDGYQRGLHSRA